jgi:hypothetical protein
MAAEARGSPAYIDCDIEYRTCSHAQQLGLGKGAGSGSEDPALPNCWWTKNDFLAQNERQSHRRNFAFPENLRKEASLITVTIGLKQFYIANIGIRNLHSDPCPPAICEVANSFTRGLKKREAPSV